VDALVVDFYAPSCKLAIEVDGEVHDTDEAQRYDRQRTAYLEGFGMRVLRFTNQDVLGNSAGVAEVIEAAVRERSALLGRRR